MKRTIVLLATLLLSFGLVIGDDNLDSVNVAWAPAPGGGETLWAGQLYNLQYWFSNSDILGGFTTGFTMYSGDGASWNWSQGIEKIEMVFDFGCMCLLPDTTFRDVCATDYGRMDPYYTGPDTVWDMQKLGLSFVADPVTDEFDGDSPDQWLIGGVANVEPLMLAGPFAQVMDMFVTFDPPAGEGTVQTVCLDTIKIGSAGDFVFAGQTLGTYKPGAWEVGTQCWPVKVMPNMPPAPTDCPGEAVDTDHCASGEQDVEFTDPTDPPDPFDIELVGHNGNGSVNITQQGQVGAVRTATVTYTPGVGDVGNTVTVQVQGTDAFGSGAICGVDFDVTNNAPTVTCPDDFAVGYDTPISKMVGGDDDDECDTKHFFMVSGPGDIDEATGEYTWTPLLADAGFKTVCVEVSDTYDADTCCFEIEVLITVPYKLYIEKTHGTLQGHFVDVDVYITDGSEDMGGFDFLIGYDNSALTFIEATPGQMLEDCGWEYFTYRYSWNGNCGNACPSGLLRIVAMAEINDGPNHPLCTIPDPRPDTLFLASLKFLVSNDRTFECMYVPIRFYWMDCGDNAISSVGGDTLFISKGVYDFVGSEPFLPEDYPELPGYYGAPDFCLEGDKGEPIRFIYIYNGGVDIICSEDIDARGDINANGVANEIADAVMFTNYFIEGLSAFGTSAEDHIEASIAASDVNADGLTLSVADLVYLIRVIIGDANAYPKPLPGAVTEISVQSGVVSYNAAYPAGAGLFVFDINGDFEAPVVLAEGMDMTYGVTNDQLRVLVYNIGSNAIQAGNILSINGDVELVEVEMADYDGFAMETAIRHLPSAFALAQNYPNPFNPSTTIKLSLPVQSDWALTVYNIAGQKVKSFSGADAAGLVNIVWDGTDSYGNSVASGIYFYKATANNFSETKKMVLMK